MKRTSITLALLLYTTSLLAADDAGTNKTLVAWVSPANLSQRGGSAMTAGVKLAGGRLLLDGKGYLVAARTQVDAKMATRQPNPRAPGPPYLPQTPAWPESPPADWLTFHLAHPGPGDAHPGDPNCAFDYQGR